MIQEIKIKYIYHSCYTLEFNDFIIIFDYFEGKLPDNPENKKLIFIATHSHGDHFSKKIFEIGNPKENIYILSSDIKEMLTKDNIIYLEDKDKDLDIDSLKFLRSSENIQFIEPDSRLILDEFIIDTYASTDKGISLTLYFDYFTIYYAGDHNYWIWPEDSPEERDQMEEDYQREIDKIEEEVDIVFIPVDPRLKENYDLGPKYILEELEPQILFPMHFREDYSITQKFYDENHEDYYTDIKVIHDQGDEFVIVLDAES